MRNSQKQAFCSIETEIFYNTCRRVPVGVIPRNAPKLHSNSWVLHFYMFSRFRSTFGPWDADVDCKVLCNWLGIWCVWFVF